MRTILLNPGPVSLSQGVRKAVAAVDLCHREPEYFDLQDRVLNQLLAVYQLDAAAWTPVLLGGSGTTSVEAIMSSLVPRNGRVLVLENGVYGERLSRLAEIHGISHTSMAHDWLDAWDMDRLNSLVTTGSFTHVAAVHHETTTGRLNPVNQLAGLCERTGVRLLLDAVSSFGAEAIDFESPALSACALTANKCLHGIPGLCVAMVRNSDLAVPVQPPRSMTLNLAHWAEHQQRRSTPFTPPVNSLLALDQALKELHEQGGWKARQAHYRRLADRVAIRLAARGVVELIPAEASSCVLRAHRVPAGKSYAAIHDALKLRGFVIYAGQGALAEEIFRISTMGEIGDHDIERLLSALDDVFS